MEDIIQKPGEDNLRQNVVTLRFSHKEHDMCYMAAWQAHSSMSGYIRAVLLEHFRRQKESEAGKQPSTATQPVS